MKRISSILLSIVLLLSSLNISIAAHYCMGYLHNYSFNITEKVPGCGMEGTEEEVPDADNQHQTSLDYENCCENLLIDLEFSDGYHLAHADICFTDSFLQAHSGIFVVNFYPQYFYDHFILKDDLIRLPDPRDYQAAFQQYII